MIVRLLLAALAAGLIAGLVMTPAQYVKTIPLIMQAEAYENGEAVHAHGSAEGEASHSHDHADGEEQLWFGRFGNTILANLVAGAGFALMLAAVALLAGVEFPAGRDGLMRGLLLGAGAWFAVQLAPSFSLPPAVPGFPYADLGDRQTWWVITVAATGLGLWLIALRPEMIAKAVGAALIVAPHMWGVPVPEDIYSEVPAYIASAYAAASLATTLLFWLLLGGLLGYFLSRIPGTQRRDGGVTGKLPALTLVLGGARSGKSAFAEHLVEAASPVRLYLATGQAWDDEMRARITTHQDRRGTGWETVEAPVELVEALEDNARADRPVLVDCLTLWVTNLMLGEHDIDAAFDRLAKTLPGLKGPVVFVSNEVGLGIVPDNAMARAFRDYAGGLHQTIAGLADEVHFVAAGLPLKMKG